MNIHPREWWLLGQVVAVERLRGIGRRVRARIRSSVQDEKGQTPTEYLMIVGLMAAVIVLVFVGFFWDNISEAAENWSNQARDAISGDFIDGGDGPTVP